MVVVPATPGGSSKRGKRLAAVGRRMGGGWVEWWVGQQWQRPEAAAGHLRDDVDLERAADYLMRMTLSWLGSPAGIDITDEHEARRVVRSQFLAGLVRS